MKKPYAWPYLRRSNAAPPRLKIFLAIASWSCASARASSITASVAASASGRLQRRVGGLELADGAGGDRPKERVDLERLLDLVERVEVHLQPQDRAWPSSLAAARATWRRARARAARWSAVAGLALEAEHAGRGEERAAGGGTAGVVLRDLGGGPSAACSVFPASLPKHGGRSRPRLRAHDDRARGRLRLPARAGDDDDVRQPRLDRAADARATSPTTSATCSGCRRASPWGWPTASRRRAGARRTSTCTPRRAWATGWARSSTPRPTSRRCWSPPGSRRARS